MEPTPQTLDEMQMEDARNMARIETATRYNTHLLYLLLGQGVLILILVGFILGILMHALIIPLPPLGGP